LRRSGFLAVALLLTLAASSLLGCGEDEEQAPPHGRPVTTADPAKAFAPLIHLHSREQAGPMNARRFADSSTFEWSNGDCTRVMAAVGRLADRTIAEEVPRLDLERLGGADPYEQPARKPPKCAASDKPYASTDITRPYGAPGRPAELRADYGFYFDLMTDAYGGTSPVKRNGQASIEDVPIYVDRQPEEVAGERGLRLRYWLLFSGNRAPVLELSSEGDWEPVSVLLVRIPGRDRYAPVSVRYRSSDGTHELPWAKIKRTAATHPVLWSADGTHSMYPRPGRHDYSARVDGRRMSLRDDTAGCARCPQWRTWRRVSDLRGEPWFGYGGAWGNPGPLGPVPSATTR
jgi:hypothetical protein